MWNILNPKETSINIHYQKRLNISAHIRFYCSLQCEFMWISTSFMVIESLCIRSERTLSYPMVSQHDSVAFFWSGHIRSYQLLHLQSLVQKSRKMIRHEIWIATVLNSNLLDLNGLPCWIMLVCWIFWRLQAVLADNADKARRCRHGFTPLVILSTHGWRSSKPTKKPALRSSKITSLKQFMALVGHWPDWWSPVFDQKETRNW